MATMTPSKPLSDDRWDWDANDLAEAEYDAQFAGLPDTLEATQIEYAQAEMAREFPTFDDYCAHGYSARAGEPCAACERESF